MCFAERASGEIHLIRIASISVATADAKAPEPIKDDCLTVRIAHLAEKLAGRIEGVDMTVSEIAD